MYENLTVDNLFASDAEWRTWCQAIEAALLSSGFLGLASDTGQLDLTTAVRPAANAFAGYRMYQAVDALAATKPMKVKVEYGCGSSTARGKFSATCAPTSNGAGTLASPTSTTLACVAATSDGTGFTKILGFGGEFAAGVHLIDVGSVSQGGLLMVGRLREQADGDPIELFFMSSAQGSNGNFMGSYYYTDGSVAWVNNSSGINSHAPDLSITIHTGGDINKTLLYECLVYRAAKTMVFPLLMGRTAELPYTDADGSQFSMDAWGGTHTFLPIPMTGGSSASNRLCALYE